MKKRALISRIRKLIAAIPSEHRCVSCGRKQEARFHVEPIDAGRNARFQVWAFSGLGNWAQFTAAPHPDEGDRIGWHCPGCYRARQLRDTERRPPRAPSRWDEPDP